MRSFVARFNKEKVSITNCNLDTAISAFRKGLRHDSDLYKELTKYPCKTMEDVLAKAWAQIKWEEDQANRSYYSPNRREVKRNQRLDRRSTDLYQRPERTNPTQFDKRRHYEQQRRSDVQSTRKILEYSLNIDPAEAVHVLRGLGQAVKWPGKLKSPEDQRDRVDSVISTTITVTKLTNV